MKKHKTDRKREGKRATRKETTEGYLCEGRWVAGDVPTRPTAALGLGGRAEEVEPQKLRVGRRRGVPGGKEGRKGGGKGKKEETKGEEGRVRDNLLKRKREGIEIEVGEMQR